MKKRGKKYLEALEKVDKNKLYTKEEAVKLVKETSLVNFDASVELAIKLKLDTKKADQQLRGAISLPHGTGKIDRVLVIAKGDQQKEAKEAGADFVGEIDLIEKIDKENWLDFDVLIATPEMMPLLGKLGKKLGPKGLMPNPKTGTVTNDIEKTVAEIKKGRIEYRTDSYGNVHTLIGKVSFADDQLIENLNAIVDVIQKNRPSTVKGNYISNITITSAMGPGVKINPNSFDK